MEIISDSIKGLALAAIAGTIVLFLSPSGATEKSIRTIVSVFLVCCVVMPFVSGDKSLDFSFSLPQKDSLNSQMNITQQAGEQLKEELKEVVSSSLASMGIEPVGVNIDININGEKISVEKIQIIVKEEDFYISSEVEKKLFDDLGIKASVLQQTAEDENENN